MDLSKLRKPDLVMLCEEMGIEVATLRRKPILIHALEDSGADEEELSECWALIQERMKRESEDKERETVRRKEEAEIQIREIERLRLQLQIVEAKCASSVREENGDIQADARLSKRDLLQPYKMSEDIALFLVNFERTCARVGFDRATWPQKLLTVLPCEAADTLARLPETDADDYNKIKAALLKKFRLSAEAFRRRFRDAQKTTSETFQDFAFNMKADLVEWLKGEGVYEDRDKVVDLICLEQFYGSIDEEMRLWIQDRPETPGTDLRATKDRELRKFIRSIIREELQTQATPCPRGLRTTPPGSNLRDVVREEVAAMTCAQDPRPDLVSTPTYAHVAALTSPQQHHSACSQNARFGK
ncbi:hypothetical protein HPB50_008816 [Hyalomma asiaticum]|uniref:Uncharacterized protein n=1 Tax=Hyalomma asiaticum TaxID=266040 RepID=A0ACB7SG37_HYAAI|nr:hypothetical protein HPB50_008816 [Hyalomma asiaticum]